MKIYLVRHAETNSNVQKIIQGTINTPLNETGHSQAECLGDRLSAVKPSHIFCSDLQRCRETLQHVLNHQTNRPVVTYTSRLQERYMAELQGVSKEEVELLLKKLNKTKFDFGESTSDLCDRVEGFWRESVMPLYQLEPATKLNGHDSNNEASGEKETATQAIFIFSHGGTLLHLTRSLLSTFGFTADLGQRTEQASPNTGVTILDTETMVLEVYADIEHLDQLGKQEKTRESTMEVVDA